jgi:hypothetical protein
MCLRLRKNRLTLKFPPLQTNHWSLLLQKIPMIQRFQQHLKSQTIHYFLKCRNYQMSH